MWLRVYIFGNVISEIQIDIPYVEKTSRLFPGSKAEKAVSG